MKPNSKGRNKNSGRYQQRDNDKGKFQDHKYGKDESRKLGNDLSWYVPDAQILNDVASLPFSNVLSDNFSLSLASPSGNIEKAVETPGVCVISYVPSYGFSYNYTPDTAQAKTDPLNIATKSVYSFVRKHNSGSANYDEVDLMQYYLAMDGVYSFWAYLVRLYGILRVYNYKNRYVPNAILGAMGFNNLDSQRGLYSSMAQLRYMINNMALRMSSLAVPTVMPIFQRHVWMNSNIFKDCDDSKAQMYIFVPKGYYTYNEENGTLDWNNMPSFGTRTPLTSIQNIIDQMLEPLLYSQSIGIMSGDTLKAYEGNIYTFGTIQEDFTVVPMYNEKILPQIHNLNTLCIQPTFIEQVDNALICHFTSSSSGYDNVEAVNEVRWQYDDILLNMPYENPTPEDVMYATRLTANLVESGVTNKQIIISGSEIPVSISYIDDPKFGSNTQTQELDKLSSRSLIFSDTTNWLKYMRMNSVSQQFDWGPRIATFVMSEDPESITSYLPYADIANYTTVSPSFLKNIHQSALCGLFGVPYTLTRA